MQAPDTTGTYNLTVTMGLLAGPDANPANDSEIVNTQVSKSSDLVLFPKAESPNPVAAGGIVNYEFSVINNGPLNESGYPVQDVEGLTLYNTRVLYGTSGVEFTDKGTDNSLYRIDKQSGATEIITRLDQNFNGFIPTDFEAISCFPICK